MRRIIQIIFLNLFIFVALDATELDMLEQSSSSSASIFPVEGDWGDLRTYQAECLDKIVVFLNQGQKLGYVKMATGTGKTRTFLKLIQHLGLKTLIVVPKISLSDQIHDTVAIHAPELKVHRYDGTKKERCENILVTTYQSLSNPEPHGYFEGIQFVILDEAHSSLSNLRVESLNQFTCPVLGFTATDMFDTQRIKGSKRAVKDLLPTKIFEYSLNKALEEGVLSPYQILKLELDEPELIASLKRKKGKDFSLTDLDHLNVQRINKSFPNIIESFPEGSLRDKIGLIFTHRKDHAENIATELNAAFGGTYASAIHSDLPQATCQDLIRRHKLGLIKVLVNVDMLTEGYDNDQVHYLIDFRPTKSSLRLLQVFGRLTRKPDGFRETPEKVYIQLILEDSGQKLLEDVLGKEGVENIKVYGETKARKPAQKRKRNPLDQQARPSSESEKKRKTNSDNINRVKKVASTDQNEATLQDDVDNATNYTSGDEADSAENVDILDELPISEAVKIAGHLDIIRAGYTLSNCREVICIAPLKQRSSQDKLQEAKALFEQKTEDGTIIDSNKEKIIILSLEVVNDPNSTLSEAYSSAELLDSVFALEESINSWIQVLADRITLSKQDTEELVTLSGENNLIEKIERLVQDYSDEAHRVKGPQYGLKLKKIDNWKKKLQDLKPFPSFTPIISPPEAYTLNLHIETSGKLTINDTKKVTSDADLFVNGQLMPNKTFILQFVEFGEFTY